MKILLATDGSTFSEAATRAVASQLRSESEVRILQVIEPAVFSSPPQMASGYAPEMASRLEQELKGAKEAVERAAEMLRTAGFKVDTRVVQNEIRTGLLDMAKEWHAELVVLGSHGRRGVKRFLLGSVAEYVARHACCSVLIVRQGDGC